MAREKLSTLQSTCVPLMIDNIDTDQIIPARFLKATTRDGFGKNLFRDWRYVSDETPKADFVLNNATYAGKVLVTGKNFGCGSSREHAAWAIYDYGFRVVVAESYSDIFYNNALNNGVLPIRAGQEFVETLAELVLSNPKTQVVLDVQNQTLNISGTSHSVKFDINPYKKECLINGYDDIDYLLSIDEKITTYEKAVSHLVS